MVNNTLPDVGDGQNLFPISTVSEATGVPPVTLRAWERRYDFLTPRRTAKGHRLYSLEQIDLIRRVTTLIDSGVPVGRVGDLIRLETAGEEELASQGDTWEVARDEMLAAVCRFDERGLDRIYERLLTRFSDAKVTEQLIIPMLRRLGASWQRGETGVAEEHFFSLYIRNKLGARWHHSEKAIAGRPLVVACMPGERHEYGLLFFALIARARGFDPVLLGAAMPLEELDKVVNQTRAAGVVISSTIQPGWQVVERDLRQLCRVVDVPVFVGGAGTLGMEQTLEAAGARPVGAELVAGVETVYRTLAAEPQGSGEDIDGDRDSG